GGRRAPARFFCGRGTWPNEKTLKRLNRLAYNSRKIREERSLCAVPKGRRRIRRQGRIELTYCWCSAPGVPYSRCSGKESERCRQTQSPTRLKTSAQSRVSSGTFSTATGP